MAGQMGAKGQRALRAVLAGGLGAALAALAVWVNLRLGLGAEFFGRGTQTLPTVPVTALSLGVQAGVYALALVPPLALMAAFSGPWPFRALSALMLALGFYWLGESLSQQFSADFGMTWLPGEAFDALFWRPGLTPALWLGAVGLYLWVLAWLNRAPPGAPRPGAPRAHASPQRKPPTRPDLSQGGPHPPR